MWAWRGDGTVATLTGIAHPGNAKSILVDVAGNIVVPAKAQPTLTPAAATKDVAGEVGRWGWQVQWLP